MNSLNSLTTMEPYATRQRNGGTVHIRASDVTGNFQHEDEVETEATTSTVATSFARAMGLPLDAPYTLRTEDGQWLLDDKPIGPQIQGREKENFFLTPKTHLG